MVRETLNLYSFFQDVALRYQNEYLGITDMSKARIADISAALQELQSAYGKQDAVDYDNPDRLVAYVLHFAPKHAVIWKRLAAAYSWTGRSHGRWQWNDIGAGPGSEVFGLLCGLPDLKETTFDVVAVDQEGAWRDVFEIARDIFIKRTGTEFDALYTNDIRNIHPRGQTIGSFCLSDAGRNGSIAGLLSGLGATSEIKECRFLDFPSYKAGTGTVYVNKAVSASGFACSYDHLPDMKLNLSDAINAEIADCPTVYCAAKVNAEPLANMHRIRLQ